MTRIVPGPCSCFEGRPREPVPLSASVPLHSFTASGGLSQGWSSTGWGILQTQGKTVPCAPEYTSGMGEDGQRVGESGVLSVEHLGCWGGKQCSELRHKMHA